MKDPMEQLRAAQPMPRGERLAEHAGTVYPYKRRQRLWWRMWNAKEQRRRWSWPDDVRLHAAPLALARERRRRERAERIADERKAALLQAWADEQATSAALHERGREIDALRTKVDRLKNRMARERENARRKSLRGRAWWCPSTDMERAASALRSARISTARPRYAQRERAWRENWTYWMEMSRSSRIRAHAAGHGVPR